MNLEGIGGRTLHAFAVIKTIGRYDSNVVK